MGFGLNSINYRKFTRCILIRSIRGHHKGGEGADLHLTASRTQPVLLHHERIITFYLLQDPRLLHCGHTFCLKCLIGYHVQGQTQIPCPQCRAATQLHNGQVNRYEQSAREIHRALLTASSLATNHLVTTGK